MIEYHQPHEVREVTIDGRRVPYLTAQWTDSGLSLTLDQRLGLDLPADLDVKMADSIVFFIADAIARGMGFASFPRDGKDPTPMPPFPMVHMIASVEHGDAEDEGIE